MNTSIDSLTPVSSTPRELIQLISNYTLPTLKVVSIEYESWYGISTYWLMVEKDDGIVVQSYKILIHREHGKTCGTTIPSHIIKNKAIELVKKSDYLKVGSTKIRLNNAFRQQFISQIYSINEFVDKSFK